MTLHPFTSCRFWPDIIFCGDPRLQHNSKRSVANTKKFMFMKCINIYWKEFLEFETGK